MIVYSRLGDTPESVTCEYLGYCDASYAGQVREINFNHHGSLMMNRSGIYADNWPIWLPNNEDIDPEAPHDIIRELEWGRSYQREALATAQRNGVNIYDILGVHQLTQRANELAHESGLTNQLSNLGYMTISNTVDLSKIRYERFDQHMKALNAAIYNYTRPEKADNRPAIEQTIRQERNTIKHLFPNLVKRYKSIHEPAFDPITSAINDTTSVGWPISSRFTANDVSSMTRALGHIGKGFFAFDFGTGIYKTIEDFKSGDRYWYDTMGKESSKIVADYVIGQVADGLLIAALGVTPVGWVAIIAIAAITAGTAMVAHHEIDKHLFNKA